MAGKSGGKGGIGPVPPGNRAGGNEKGGPSGNRGPSSGSAQKGAAKSMRRSQNKGGGR